MAAAGAQSVIAPIFNANDRYQQRALFLVQPILKLIAVILDDIERRYNTSENPDGPGQNRERSRGYRPCSQRLEHQAL